MPDARTEEAPRSAARSSFFGSLLALLLLALALWLLLRFFPMPVGMVSSLVYFQTMDCRQLDNLPQGQGSPDLIVYTNRTPANTPPVQVTGDLKVTKNTCDVRVTYGPGVNDHYDISATANDDANDSSTVAVPAGFQMKIHCRVTPRRNKCDWKYQRTSP